MAYVQGFESDIFISYAHVDNLTVGSQSRGWVEQFHEYLEIRLGQRIGRMGVVKIWRDPALDGSQFFDETISNAVDKSALMLCLTSNGHLASDYCQDEIKWFFKKASKEPAGIAIGDRSRLMNVLINNIAYNRWPGVFEGTSGFHLFEAEYDHELGEPSEPGSKLFNKQIRKLVDTIYEVLCDFAEDPLQQQSSADNQSAGPEVDPDGDNFTIYIADVADSLRTTQRRLVNELKQHDLTILKSIPPPFEESGHDAAVKKALQQAKLSIHLLDQFSGREIDASGEVTYPQRQARLAVEHGSSPYIWVPKILDLDSLEDVGQQGLIAGLQADSEKTANIDFIRGTPATLAAEILEKAAALQKPAPATAPAGLNGVRAALLDTHIKDQLHAFELSRYLLEKQIQPYMVAQDDDPGKSLQIFETSLEQTLNNTGIPIVFFGEVNIDWVRERIGHAAKTAITRGLPLRECAVYLAPPEKKSVNIEFGFLKVHLLDNSKKFNPATFAPIFEGRA